MRDWLTSPWSRRRAGNEICALIAAIPGVRRYVLSTTPLKAHPMFAAHERAVAKIIAASRNQEPS